MAVDPFLDDDGDGRVFGGEVELLEIEEGAVGPEGGPYQADMVEDLVDSCDVDVGFVQAGEGVSGGIFPGG